MIHKYGEIALFLTCVLQLTLLSSIVNTDQSALDPNATESPTCPCSMKYEPVCGVDGRTHRNNCSATECHGTKIARTGECSQGESAPVHPLCVCPDRYDPVCGSDGKKHRNTCEVQCAGLQVVSSDQCPMESVTVGNSPLQPGLKPAYL